MNTDSYNRIQWLDFAEDFFMRDFEEKHIISIPLQSLESIYKNDLSNYNMLFNTQSCMYCISVKDDFSETPGTEFIRNGKFSGEEFFNKLLKPIFEKEVIYDDFSPYYGILIDFDGTYGIHFGFVRKIIMDIFNEIKNSDKYNKKCVLLIFKSNDQQDVLNDITEYYKLLKDSLKEGEVIG